MTKDEIATIVAGLRRLPMSDADYLKFQELADKMSDKLEERLARVAVVVGEPGELPRIVVAGQVVEATIIDFDTLGTKGAGAYELNDALTWVTYLPDPAAMGALQDKVVEKFRTLGLNI